MSAIFIWIAWCSAIGLPIVRRSCAYASARTFAAYEIVFRPAVAERSFRVHGATATRVVSGADATSTATTNAVGVESTRPEPGGLSPPVTVRRSRASERPLASSTASAATR